MLVFETTDRSVRIDSDGNAFFEGVVKSGGKPSKGTKKDRRLKGNKKTKKG